MFYNSGTSLNEVDVVRKKANLIYEKEALRLPLEHLCQYNFLSVISGFSISSIAFFW